MTARRRPGAQAAARSGGLHAHRWLIARRSVQAGILALFLAGPWFGAWIVEGNLSSSLVLGVVPLTDPFLFAQSAASGHVPAATAALGAAIVLAFYAVAGGRVYCAWVCPLNVVTDAAHWLRERLGVSPGWQPARVTRLWLAGAVVGASALTGTLVWEYVNPVSLTHRGIVFGMGLGWAVVAGVFVFDLLVSRRGWCGRLCPVGAFYGLVGRISLVRVRADARDACNDCMDCVAVCPEAHIIMPVLKGGEKGVGPVIASGECSNCGRCIDVCSERVFSFGARFPNQSHNLLAAGASSRTAEFHPGQHGGMRR